MKRTHSVLNQYPFPILFYDCGDKKDVLSVALVPGEVRAFHQVLLSALPPDSARLCGLYSLPPLFCPGKPHH